MKRLLVFGILLLGLVLVGCTQVQQTQDDLTEKWMPQKARSCIDTDQVPPTNTGHDSAAYGIKGTTISTGVVSQRRIDSCAADGKLLEYYCENKAIKSETYACPNDCKDGACVKTATPTPTPAITACREAGGSCVSIRDVSLVYRNCDSDGSKRRLDCGDSSKYCCVPKSNPTATPTPTPSATPTATATATPTPTPTATVTATPTPGTYVACGSNNAGMCYKSANYDGTNRHYGCPLGLQQLTEAAKECSSLGAYCCKQPAAGSCESVNGICNAGQPFYPTVCSWTQFSRAPDSATGSCPNNELCCRPSDEAYRVSAAVTVLATPAP